MRKIENNNQKVGKSLLFDASSTTGPSLHELATGEIDECKSSSSEDTLDVEKEGIHILPESTPHAEQEDSNQKPKVKVTTV